MAGVGKVIGRSSDIFAIRLIIGNSVLLGIKHFCVETNQLTPADVCDSELDVITVRSRGVIREIRYVISYSIRIDYS